MKTTNVIWIITASGICLGVGAMKILKKMRVNTAEKMFKGYKKTFGIQNDKQFEQTVINNKTEYARRYEREIKERGLEYKIEELKQPNKWLYAACYLQDQETSSWKQKMQLLKIIRNFNTVFACQQI